MPDLNGDAIHAADSIASAQDHEAASTIRKDGRLTDAGALAAVTPNS